MTSRSIYSSGAPGAAIIAGGGIGGLAAGLALARYGIASHILERRLDYGEEGAGIQIGPNGSKILAELGLATALKPSAAVPEGIRLRDALTGHEIGFLPLGNWIAKRHGAPYWTLRRSDLHKALFAAAVADPLVSLSRGAGVTEAREESHRVVVTVEDGRHWTGDLLVAADGVWSKLRADLFSKSSLQFTGKFAARAVVPVSALPTRLSGNEVNIWLAPNAHFVHYPISAGQNVALVAVFHGGEEAEDWSTARERTWIEHRFRPFVHVLRELLSAPPHWRSWSLQTLRRLPQFAVGRIALLGDAAHPVLPFLAQGGVLALEDAVVLADCLASGPGGGLQERLAEYDRRRYRRARRVAQASRFNGRIYHLSGWLAAMRNRGVSLIGAERVMAGYDWLYGWSLQQNARP